jgi:S-adenosylmethionine:tRNA ribosyltransferase-isomerase
MSPANAPRPASAIRVLEVDGARIEEVSTIVDRFRAGDVVLVNDAATLPASLRAGDGIEVRLLSFLGEDRWLAALLGEGDFRTRTEHRAPPRRVDLGEELVFDPDLRATIEAIRPESPRLVVLRFAGPRLWEALYRLGKPVQYAHVPEPIALWDVQNVYAGRPWSVEMPSAGRLFRADTVLALRAKGVEVVALTHAAGLSAVGDAVIDAMLPLPERYEIPRATMEAARRARRVVAVGTSVVRALETAARTGELRGTTDLRLGPGVKLAIVDAVLTGIHEADTSHHALLQAFSPRRALAHVLEVATEKKMLGHEFGDALLVWGSACY